MQKQYSYGDVLPVGEKVNVGDIVSLQGARNHGLPVVACQETHVPMLNIDANQLAAGDLKFIKSLGLTISNPDTDKPVALGVDYEPESFGDRLKDYFGTTSSESDDDDDSSFFTPTAGGIFGGSSSFGGFGGSSSFGGFGGGGFGGGGASRGF